LKRALITGIYGQDGSYLAEFLLDQGYEVHGIVRRSTVEKAAHKLSNLAAVQDRVILHVASLENHLSLYKVIAEVRPDECYHLAASSFVSYSFDDEFSILNTNFQGTHYLLASLKELAPGCRFYFAGSSEMFGHAPTSPQDEDTPFNPRSIYGISKLASHHLVRNYRDRYGMFACTGILYNHESPRRGFEFVTRKITSTAAQIALGQKDRLQLGNLDALRDWGYAPDYVRAMWLMLQADEPGEHVVATGVLHSVRDFVRLAFEEVGLDPVRHVETDPRFFRESERVPLCGDASRTRELLGWEPTLPFDRMIQEMVRADLARLQAGSDG